MGTCMYTKQLNHGYTVRSGVIMQHTTFYALYGVNKITVYCISSCSSLSRHLAKWISLHGTKLDNYPNKWICYLKIFFTTTVVAFKKGLVVIGIVTQYNWVDWKINMLPGNRNWPFTDKRKLCKLII